MTAPSMRMSCGGWPVASWIFVFSSIPGPKSPPYTRTWSAPNQIMPASMFRSVTWWALERPIVMPHWCRRPPTLVYGVLKPLIVTYCDAFELDALDRGAGIADDDPGARRPSDDHARRRGAGLREERLRRVSAACDLDRVAGPRDVPRAIELVHGRALVHRPALEPSVAT